jgi:hypothetical protein
MKFSCTRCGNSGWCCEEHTEAPIGHRLNRGAECGGAGIPCPICNTAEPAISIKQTAACLWRVDRGIKTLPRIPTRRLKQRAPGLESRGPFRKLGRSQGGTKSCEHIKKRNGVPQVPPTLWRTFGKIKGRARPECNVVEG